ncbi:MAG TPA: FtsX-like permease family protein, partial [Gemmatimonadaceae bacterium]|nr:FtsX-like permease family protein [Gemmatimonadaceae bacterium]
GRWALVRQLLVENGVLALVGGIVGLGVGSLIIRLIARSDAGQFAMLRDARLDLSVLAFTAAVTIIAALLFGVLPALRTTRVSASDVLKESAGRGMSAGPGRSRFLQGAVVVQVALALVLLLGSGLVIRSLANLLESDPGFRADQVMTMQISIGGAHYATPASRLALHDEILDRLRAIPGVQSVGTAWGLPFTDFGSSSPFRVVGHPPVTGDVQPHADMWYVGGDYFRTMGIQLVEGRTFSPTDVEGAQQVSIIDETLAKQFFPNEDPIGKQIVQGMGTTIVGVVRSVKKSDLGAPDKATVYYPFPQVSWAIGTMSLAVRSTLPPSTVANLVRSTIRDLDKDMPVTDIMPMQERVDHSLGARRLAMSVLAGFAALSLVLAVLGLYGVLSYGVSQRRHEIGIRLALGAETGDVVRLVVRNGLLLVVLGLAIGSAVFLGLGQLMTALLYGVGTHDPLTLVAGIVLLGLTALVACWVPARRAARVDPVDALRVE